MLNSEEFRRIARNALRGNWPLAVGTGFIALILGASSRWGSSNGNGGESSSHRFISIDIDTPFLGFISVMVTFILLWTLITFFIGAAIELGYCRFNKNLINDTNPRFVDLFSRTDIFLKALGLRIVITIFTFLWAILLIIPGIIAAFSYSMAFYIMEENPSMGIMEAISKSIEMMRGNKYRLFCLAISFIGWILLCALTLGIATLWVAPYMHASFAAFYLEVSGKLNQRF